MIGIKQCETQSIKSWALLSTAFSGSDSLLWCSFWPLYILLWSTACNEWPLADRRVSFCMVYEFHSSRGQKHADKECSWMQSPAPWAALSQLQPPISAFLSCCLQWQLWQEELVDMPCLGRTHDPLPLSLAGILEVGEENFIVNMLCSWYLPLPFSWQSKAVRNSAPIYPRGERSPQTRAFLQPHSAPTLHHSTGSGSSKNITSAS